LLFFRQSFVILLRETNGYFHQYVASLDEAGKTAQQPDITMEEMYRFFAIMIQMGHDHVIVSKITGAEKNNISLRFTLI